MKKAKWPHTWLHILQEGHEMINIVAKGLFDNCASDWNYDQSFLKTHSRWLKQRLSGKISQNNKITSHIISYIKKGHCMN